MQKLSKSKMASILYIQCKSHEIGKSSYLVLICQTPRHSWSKNACFLTLVWCQRCRISRHSVRNETLTSNPGYSKIRMSESELQRVRSRKYDEIHDKFHYPRGIGDCRNFQPIRASSAGHVTQQVWSWHFSARGGWTVALKATSLPVNLQFSDTL